MYAVIRHHRIADPVARAEMMRQAKEGFAPIVSSTPGFVAYYALEDAGSGVFASVSIFEDQKAAEESFGTTARFVEQNLVPLTQDPPQVTAGEVAAYEAKDIGSGPPR